MHEELENELAALKPAAPDADVERRIGRALERGHSRGDRCLMAACAGGLAAALLIGALLITDDAALHVAPAGGGDAAIGDTPRMLAQWTHADAPAIFPPATHPNGDSL